MKGYPSHKVNKLTERSSYVANKLSNFFTTVVTNLAKNFKN